MVLQDTWLYNGTIMENIRYGRPDATDKEVVAAAKAAHADHFIRTLPESYKMVLNEEASNVVQDPHAELLAQNGFYAELYNSQFEQVAVVA